MLFSAATIAQNCSELFISEYVEGWSNNKALEIYNPTASPINLSGYFVARYSNGATTVSTANAIQLTGTIAAYSAYVAVLDKRDPNGTGQEAPIWDSLEVRADGFYCPVYATSNTFYWNGNDAVALFKGSTSNISGAVAVDIFGKIGEDPGTGWTTQSPYVGVGVVVTADHSMIRKQTIEKGVTNPGIPYFNPLAEWDTIPAVIERRDQNGDVIFGGGGNPILDGNWYSLGWHRCNCDPNASVKENTTTLTGVQIFPNPSETGLVYVKANENIASIKVCNSLGQVISTLENMNANSIQSIQINEKGFFFLTIQSKEGMTTTKRIIVK